MIENFITFCYESFFLNENDLWHNKDKWENDDINILFVVGHSGSGKSTLARSIYQEGKIDYIELDDVIWAKDHFTMEDLKEYGTVIYSFFQGPGNKYYLTTEEIQNSREFKDCNYEFELIRDFLDYVDRFMERYKKENINYKLVLEGIWLLLFVKPEALKDYAICIKGTSAWISNWRASVRDMKYAVPDKYKIIKRGKSFIGRFKVLFNGGVGSKDSGLEIEKILQNWRRYYSRLSV